MSYSAAVQQARPFASRIERIWVETFEKAQHSLHSSEHFPWVVLYLERFPMALLRVEVIYFRFSSNVSLNENLDDSQFQSNFITSKIGSG